MSELPEMGQPEFKQADQADLRRSRKRARRERRSLRRGDRLTVRGWLYGKAYRVTMRLAHRFDWHYAPVSGPLMPASPDGRDYQRWCQWCGFRENFNPNPGLASAREAKLKRMGRGEGFGES